MPCCLTVWTGKLRRNLSAANGKTNSRTDSEKTLFKKAKKFTFAFTGFNEIGPENAWAGIDAAFVSVQWATRTIRSHGRSNGNIFILPPEWGTRLWSHHRRTAPWVWNFTGRHVQTELIPYIIHDYCQPRPVRGSKARQLMDEVYRRSLGPVFQWRSVKPVSAPFAIP
jgi:hypothetical protein